MGTSSETRESGLRRIGRIPILGRGLLFGYRLRSGLSVAKDPLLSFARWVFASREYTNYTYDLTDLNKGQLAWFVSLITGISPARAREYLAELESDQNLLQQISEAIMASRDRCFADLPVRFGRRLGWYAIARATKPRTIVETGVDKGLGACVLAAAIRRNQDEGAPGYYYGVDINPAAGYLLSGPYASHGRILYGDSIRLLEAFDEEIDLFINDSDHAPPYEASEYLTIDRKLSERAIVLGDNSHRTIELQQFAERTRRLFLYFHERPQRHWYPGGGIGAAFRAMEPKHDRFP